MSVVIALTLTGLPKPLEKCAIPCAHGRLELLHERLRGFLSGGQFDAFLGRERRAVAANKLIDLAPGAQALSQIDLTTGWCTQVYTRGFCPDPGPLAELFKFRRLPERLGLFSLREAGGWIIH
jgi:hypothetical protein